MGASGETLCLRGAKASAVFTGSYQLSVDDKGRLAIPARLRQRLCDEYGPTVYVTKGWKPCLEIHPARAFHDIVEQIRQMPDQDAAETLKLTYIGRAVEAELDRQGRVMLPPLLRSAAGVDGKVVLVGMGNRFDVWSEGAYAEEMAAREADMKSALAQIRR